MFKNKLFVSMVAILVVAISIGFYGTGRDKDNLFSASEMGVIPAEMDLVPGMTTGANMPTYSYHGGDFSFVRNDTGWVFCVGGDLTGSGSLTTKNERYNVNTNTWTVMAPYPTAPGIWYTDGATLGTKGYICGGLTGGALSNTTAQLTEYDINANTWTVKASMPSARAFGQLIAYQDSLLYYIGGFDATGTSQVNVYLYNNIANTWRVATSLPASRMGFAGAIKGDTLVVVNGTSGTFNGTVQLTTYRGIISSSDRSTITWNTGANYPGTGRYRQKAETWGCLGVVVSGGGSAAAYTPAVNECYVYSPGANTWTLQPTLITTRTAHMTGSVRLANNVWKFVNVCGFNGANVLTTDILTDTLCPTGGGNLCEQFTDPAFPPTGWASSGAFWLRSTASSFGLGTGSAKYDMWNAPNGTNQTLSTVNFAPTTGAQVRLSLAYAQFSTGLGRPDSIIVESSTDGGSTYTALARWGWSFMETAPPSGTEFTPTATQWKKVNVPLPNGTNKLRFTGKSGFGNNAYLDSICVQNFVGINPISGVVPGVYSLAQNYPNPFNPTTNIKFGLPVSGNVKLVVFDILGREVATLVNEFKSAGEYVADFDASAFSSGVYFYRLESGSFVETKRMLLVK